MGVDPVDLSTMAPSCRIGVISDTHGYLDPVVLEIFRGVDHILHAGDIGQPSLILDLEEVAPVTAVLGNNDAGLEFREREVVQLANRAFLVEHIVNPHRLEPGQERVFARHSPHLVVFGHTHQRFHQHIGGRWFLNPGYSGRPRFGQPRSVAIVACGSGGTLEVEFYPL